MDIENYHNIFFIGIAGSGMSALAWYLAGQGKNVSGSDRFFGTQDEPAVRSQLEKGSIKCFPQDGSGILSETDLVVYSTAVEENNIEYKKARQSGIEMITRPDLLALIANNKTTIAIGGTAGKSTTTAMVFHILQRNGFDPSLITGAGLNALISKGIPGNAWVGKSDFLVIEADESNGTIVNYMPEISALLNMDRDHKSEGELLQLFTTFKNNTRGAFIVNDDHASVARLSQDRLQDFGSREGVGYCARDFVQDGFSIRFTVNDVPFSLALLGRYNMENAVAAVAVCGALGLSVESSAKALESFDGIYRRAQVVGTKNGITVVDDFAHNPAEVRAALKACQEIAPRVFAWFQPHGFGPLRFMHKEMTQYMLDTLRDDDVYLSSDVYYAGGTVAKDINGDIVTDAIAKGGKKAHFTPVRDDLLPWFKKNARQGDIILLMGARDPVLANFAKDVLAAL